MAIEKDKLLFSQVLRDSIHNLDIDVNMDSTPPTYGAALNDESKAFF